MNKETLEFYTKEIQGFLDKNYLGLVNLHGVVQRSM